MVIDGLLPELLDLLVLLLEVLLEVLLKGLLPLLEVGLQLVELDEELLLLVELLLLEGVDDLHVVLLVTGEQLLAVQDRVGLLLDGPLGVLHEVIELRQPQIVLLGHVGLELLLVTGHLLTEPLVLLLLHLDLPLNVALLASLLVTDQLGLLLDLLDLGFEVGLADLDVGELLQGLSLLTEGLQVFVVRTGHQLVKVDLLETQDSLYLADLLTVVFVLGLDLLLDLLDLVLQTLDLLVSGVAEHLVVVVEALALKVRVLAPVDELQGVHVLVVVLVVGVDRAYQGDAGGL